MDVGGGELTDKRGRKSYAVGPAMSHNLTADRGKETALMSLQTHVDFSPTCLQE